MDKVDYSRWTLELSEGLALQRHVDMFSKAFRFDFLPSESSLTEITGRKTARGAADVPGVRPHSAGLCLLRWRF